MIYDSKQELSELDFLPPHGWRSVAALPAGFVLTERAVAALRAFLEECGLGDYQIFSCADHEMWDIDQHLARLGETARWDQRGLDADRAQPLTLLSHDKQGAQFWPSGFLRLEHHEAVVARWYWLDGKNGPVQLWLCAVPSAEHYMRLNKALHELRHARGAAVWQIIRDSPYDAEQMPRQGSGDDLAAQRRDPPPH